MQLFADGLTTALSRSVPKTFFIIVSIFCACLLFSCFAFRRPLLCFAWERKGIAQGIVEGISQGLTQGISQGLTQGKEALVVRLLRRRLGPVPDRLLARLAPLTAAQLDDLGEALLDFETPADLEQWLDQH